MSVTGDYCLWLGKDRMLEPLDGSTRELSRRIDEAEWGGEEPGKTMIDGLTVYYWSGVIGPYYRDGESSRSIEGMIEEVKAVYPNIDWHYSMFVWVEGQFQRVDGRFHEHNMFTWKTIDVATEDLENSDVPKMEEMRTRICRSLGRPSIR